MNPLTLIKSGLILLLTLGFFLIILIPFSGSINLFEVLTDGDILSIIWVISLAFPIFFLLLSFILKIPFSIYSRLLFLSLFLIVCFILWVIHVIMGFYDKKNFIYDSINFFYFWITAYRWLVFFFGLWSLALAFPDLNRFKFFNWPFEWDENAPKEWVPPRER